MILFKDNSKVFLIENDILVERLISDCDDIREVKHLDEVDALYHIELIGLSSKLFAVLFKHKDKLIIGINDYYLVLSETTNMRKDYTLVNLKTLNGL